jgi:hypothetical protein
MKDPKVVLAELKKLADLDANLDDVFLTDFEHDFIQATLQLGFIRPCDRAFAEATVEKYREEAGI